MVDYEQRPPERMAEKRFAIPDYDDGFHYTIQEKPGPNDEGSSSEDQVDLMGYEYCGPHSRRKNVWRIPKEDRKAIEDAFQAKSQKTAKTPSTVRVEGGAVLEGVQGNYIEDEAPVDINSYLGK